MSVGENIKRLREGKKWTQQELADKHYFRKHGPDAYYGQKK